MGAEEDGVPRMVKTPWEDEAIPMSQAAELGTERVIREHCTIALVVTTDGTVTDIPRESYMDAERRAITDLQATGKPFIVIVNSRDPQGQAARDTAASLQSEFGITAAIADCQSLDSTDIAALLHDLLCAFPMQELRVTMPRWMDALEPEHPVKGKVLACLKECAEQITTLSSAAEILARVGEMEDVSDFSVDRVDPAVGAVCCTVRFPDALYYSVLSARTGMEIRSDADLLAILTELAAVKVEYDKISDALAAARATGYGIVMPTAEEMTLQTPEVIRKGGAFGVKLKAGAPSIHMIRVDVDTQINPMVGDEQQSKDLIAHLSGEDPEKLWQSNIFGKSVYELIQDGLSAKLTRTPEEVRTKFRGSLCRIVNDGAAGLICIIL